MPKSSVNNGLESNDLTDTEVVLTGVGFVWEWLDARSILSFSQTCRTAMRISSRPSITNLLTAVVRGNEDLARAIIISRPGLLLDSSAIVTDISGKEIKALTPLQAAICAGDTDMVQMMHDVLQYKLQTGIQLSFDPESEMQRQFKAIYSDGIDSVETAQKTKAQEFKNYMRMSIFNAIINATPQQVACELNTPGQGNTDNALNAALHTFREQFTAASNFDQIFNPFYLLKAFELYNDEVNKSNDWNRIDLFWRQIIGYIQRHLPACYLQAFAQGIYHIVENDEKLRRGFGFRYDNKTYMLPSLRGSHGLGYLFASRADAVSRAAIAPVPCFKKLFGKKRSGLERLFTPRIAAPRLV